MKKILTSIVAASLLTTSAFAMDAQTAKISHNAVIKAEKKAQKENPIISEAINAIRNTQDALIYLNAKQISKAKKAIELAIANLSDVLNRPNPPYLLPVNVNIMAYQFKGNLQTIKKDVEEAKTLVIENKLPQAREILNTLRDEIDIKTVNLPLATYPAALNLALRYINAGKIKEAKDVLVMALSTLVEVKTIIPIPLVKAQQLVIAASKMVKKNKKEAIRFLEEAKHQLILANALGYSSTSATTYKMLENQIRHLEKEIRANHKTEGLFERLIDSLKLFKAKAITHSTE